MPFLNINYMENLMRRTLSMLKVPTWNYRVLWLGIKYRSETTSSVIIIKHYHVYGELINLAWAICAVGAFAWFDVVCLCV